MAIDHHTKLFDVLTNGYHLNTQLQALLSRPLDSLGQQEAMAFSQELSRVFKLSMAMLNSNTVTRVKTAPEIRTGDSSGIIFQAAKDKRARSDNGKVVTPVKKSREDGVTTTRKEITASPHNDGYPWRKYGQKNIRDCNFVRYYFKCSRDRRCEAKKKVQQQDDDDSRGQQQLPPMFEVTYVNEHTCHVLRAIANDDAARMAMASPRTTNRYHHHVPGVVDTARDGGGGSGVLFHDLSSPSFARIGGGGGSAQENETIVSCLADVIRGGASPSPSPSPWPPVAEAAGASSGPAAASSYVPPAPMLDSGHSASVGVAEDGGGAMMMMMDMDTEFCWDHTMFCAVGEADLLMDHRDMHVDVARLADTVWPRHTSAGAWR